jgi:hypothetical protein
VLPLGHPGPCLTSWLPQQGAGCRSKAAANQPRSLFWNMSPPSPPCYCCCGAACFTDRKPHLPQALSQEARQQQASCTAEAVTAGSTRPPCPPQLRYLPCALLVISCSQFSYSAVKEHPKLYTATRGLADWGTTRPTSGTSGFIHRGVRSISTATAAAVRLCSQRTLAGRPRRRRHRHGCAASPGPSLHCLCSRSKLAWGCLKGWRRGLCPAWSACMCFPTVSRGSLCAGCFGSSPSASASPCSTRCSPA